MGRETRGGACSLWVPKAIKRGVARRNRPIGGLTSSQRKVKADLKKSRCRTPGEKKRRCKNKNKEGDEVGKQKSGKGNDGYGFEIERKKKRSAKKRITPKSRIETGGQEDRSSSKKRFSKGGGN